MAAFTVPISASSVTFTKNPALASIESVSSAAQSNRADRSALVGRRKTTEIHLTSSSRTFFGSKSFSISQRQELAFEIPSIRASAVETEEAVDYQKLNDALLKVSPREVIEDALRRFGNDVAISFSGAEDVVLIEYASQTKLPFRVFSLDTGRLHPETYRFFDKVEKHYGIHIEYTFPESAEVEKLVREKGMFSFYEDGHQECCGIRKVRPLRKQLSGLKAWITGQRKDQSPGTRTSIPTVQVDPSFKGPDGADLIKYNPLAEVSSFEVWTTIRMLEVPYNELHEKGVISIGCEPCTKAILPSQHEREGRWWWEEATQKECGLHKGNIAK
mmetsp:Transcript_41569/g.67456  ORF Transcript_41569/g.67456 Transcript_41569/m.67456 type:complete len:330 (-) Transcript_41569:501-1490(-)